MGAYGFVLRGSLFRTSSWFQAPRPGDPVVDVRWDRADDDDGQRQTVLDEDRADVPLLSGGWVTADRRSCAAVFHKAARPAGGELAHPCASIVAMLFAAWTGRQALHAGAVVVHGEAWGILAHKGAGKSSLVAWLAARGVDVLADDLVVVDDGMVNVGPRCVDLRRDGADEFARSFHDVPLASVRGGERRRLTLPDGGAPVPLGGWIALADGPRIEAVDVPTRERVSRLLAGRSVLGLEPEARSFLELVAAPMIELRRPRSWYAMEPAIDQLLGAIDRRA